MKKYLKLSILLLSVGLLTLNSCSEDENILDETIKNQLTENLKIFKNNFESEFKNLNFDSKKSGTITAINEKGNKEDLGIGYTSIEITLDGKVSGYYIEIEGEGHYIDLGSNNKINHFYVNNPKEKLEFELTQNDELGYKLPNFTKIHISNLSNVQAKCDNDAAATACVVTCGISAGAIALSDGPAPFMDVLAVSYFGSCTTGCALQYNCD